MRRDSALQREIPLQLNEAENKTVATIAHLLVPIFKEVAKNRRVAFQVLPLSPRIPEGTPAVHAALMLERLGPEADHAAQKIIPLTPGAIHLGAIAFSVTSAFADKKGIRHKAIDEIRAHAELAAIKEAGIKIKSLEKAEP